MKLTRKRQYKKGGPEAAEDAPALRPADFMGPEGGKNGKDGAERKGQGENLSEVSPNDSASQVQLNQMLRVPHDRKAGRGPARSAAGEVLKAHTVFTL